MQNNFKSDLRVSLLAKRTEAAGNPSVAEALCRRLSDWLAEQNFSSVGFYYPIRGEIDLRGVISNWLSGQPGRTASMPVITDNVMYFHEWTPETPMAKGYARIPEPQGSTRVEPDLLLVACVGCDFSNFRLGYGGGWYDRYVASHPHIKTAGICYDACRVESIRPESFDRKMDWIMTDRDIFF